MSQHFTWSFVQLCVIIATGTPSVAKDVNRLTQSNFWHGDLGTALGEGVLEAADDCAEGTDFTCLKGDKFRLEIQQLPHTPTDINCANVLWKSSGCQTLESFEDCVDMSLAHWYGGTMVKQMSWPVETWSYPSEPYVIGDIYRTQFGGVMERYWVTSWGTGYYVDWEVPLWVGINEGGNKKLCFKAQYTGSPYYNHDESPLILNYTVCQGRDARHVHEFMVATYISKPTGIPDERLFRYPIWSTWAQYKQNVTQAKVIEYATAINENGFSNSQIEIDDKWEKYYGDMEFDREKFPDPKGIIQTLAEMGFRTTLWIHPFVNLDSPSLDIGISHQVFVRDHCHSVPGVTNWWAGDAAMLLDFTAEQAVDWFSARLNALRNNYNLSSFKFDAGETNWMPECYRLAETARNPNTHTTRYVEAAYKLDSVVRSQEVRVGVRTQHVPIFVRLMDKDSRWSTDNGLETIIPHAINFGLIGYPFILPDMIGGNAYGALPDRELFIRWTELNVFLPSIQFSIAPWQFDEEVVAIARKMCRLHERYAQKMIELAREATVTGAPIVRPLWWIAPQDATALRIDSEFLVGDDLLVAPVVVQGARSRDVYLPAGKWRDELRGAVVLGGQWLRDYAVELDELPYFTRL